MKMKENMYKHLLKYLTYVRCAQLAPFIFQLALQQHLKNPYCLFLFFSEEF